MNNNTLKAALIHEVRNHWKDGVRNHTGDLLWKAADRIEALEAERDTALAELRWTQDGIRVVRDQMKDTPDTMYVSPKSALKLMDHLLKGDSDE